MARFRLQLIKTPDWARRPDLCIENLATVEYDAIQKHRAKLLAVVHDEIEEYINTPGLYGEGDSFPDRLLMTGAYYIGSEYYEAHENPSWIQISIMCHCLEHARAHQDREEDYLGLEVWLKCLPGHYGSFEVYRNTDSSSI